MVVQHLVEAAAFAGHMVPGDLGSAFKGGRERKIGGAENMPVIIPGGDADEGEGNLFLLTKADSGDGPLFGVPEDAEELLHSSPLIPAVGGVFEAFLVHGVYRLGGMGEEGVCRRNTEAQTALKGQAETADPGQELDPGKEKPDDHPAEACDHRLVENEIEGEETGDQKYERPELACCKVAAAPQGHRKDS